jgi:hypothetical protein
MNNINLKVNLALIQSAIKVKLLQYLMIKHRICKNLKKLCREIKIEMLNPSKTDNTKE